MTIKFSEWRTESVFLNEQTDIQMGKTQDLLVEHYATDLLTPLTTILSDIDLSGEEKLKQLTDTFKANSLTLDGVAKMIAGMLYYCGEAVLSPKEFFQLYLTVGASKNRVKMLVQQPTFKKHFSQENIDYVFDNWKLIQARFIMLGAKLRVVPGLNVKYGANKSIVGWQSMSEFLKNIPQAKPEEIQSFLAAINKSKLFIDKKFKAQFKALPDDDTPGFEGKMNPVGNGFVTA